MMYASRADRAALVLASGLAIGGSCYAWKMGKKLDAINRKVDGLAAKQTFTVVLEGDTSPEVQSSLDGLKNDQAKVLSILKQGKEEEKGSQPSSQGNH